MAGSAQETFDVAVIGFGPVGAALAALLGQQGLGVVVLDKSEHIYPLPRAFALDHEAMRTFQQIGIADSLATHMTPYRPTLYLGADGAPIQHFDMGPAPYPLGWAPAYTFNQPALETSLRAAVAALPSVTVRLGHEVLDTVQDDAGVTLTVQPPAAGEAQTLRARYVVACDGGTSPTRKRLGLTLKSLAFDEPWVVIDLRVHEDKLDALPATNLQQCDPERPCTYVVGPGNHRRWEFLLRPDEAGQRELSTDAIWQLLAPWLRPDEAELWRAATYRFHAVVLNDWRRGRVLLAGDAAHQMPPFLAQGMCQGLRDAANLAWKLGWVLTGRADDALLDSYGAERGPQVEEITATVKRLGQIICERDVALAQARDARLRAEQGGQVRVQLRQQLLPGLHHGLIDTDTAPCGTPFPQPRVQATDGTSAWLDDQLAPGFLLVLRATPTPEQQQAWAAARAALGLQVLSLAAVAAPDVITLQERDGVVADWLTHHDAVAALVRPDHVVFGTADTAAAIAPLLARACTAMGLPLKTEVPA